MEIFVFFYYLILIYTTSSLQINEEDLELDEYYITSTKLNTYKVLNPRSKRSTNSCNNLEIVLNATTFKLCVYINNNTIYDPLTEGTNIILFQNYTEKVTKLSSFDIKFATGYVVNYESSSFLDGYIENDTFYGRVAILNDVFYIEHLQDYPNIRRNHLLDDIGTDKSIIYKTFLEKTLTNEILYLLNKEKFMKNTRPESFGNICTLIPIIDYSFLRMVGKGNLHVATAIVINSISRTNSVFRSTDFNFDGAADNIGLRIKNILVMNSEAEQYPHIKYYNKSVSSKDFLEKLTYFKYLQDCCLAIVFTGQSFLQKIVGISYSAFIEKQYGFLFSSGGICIPNVNVLAISYFHGVTRIPQVISDITLIHELGHSFGSRHDDNTKRCSGYVMSSKTASLDDKNKFLFSPCSRKQMFDIISMRRSCLEYDRSSFCGNGIVEENEDCDCGSSYECYFTDKCCVAFNKVNGCKVNREGKHQCHPSQGLCCTSECVYRDITHLGISCKNFEKKCTKKNEETCGVNGSCINRQCHSVECARIGLQECQCPTHITNTNCQICCNLEHSCISSKKATKTIIKSRPALIENLQKYHYANSSLRTTEIVQLFCENGICIKLVFRQFGNKDYCAFKGNLGYCNKNVCLVEKKRLFPAMHKENIKNTYQVNKNFTVLNLIMFLYIFYI